MALTIGRRFDNRPLTLPWPACPHILIGGETGSGKSGTLNALIAAAAGCADTAICGIDLKLVEQWPWRDRFTVTATTTDDADRLLADLRSLIATRSRFLQDQGLRMWRPEFGPWILFVVDELAELSGFDPDALVQAAITGETKDTIRDARGSSQVRIALLGSLARLARFCGITIVAATQYPSHEVVDQQIRTQLTIRIMLRVASGEQIDVCLGRGYGKRISVRSIPVKQRGGLWVAGLPDDPEPFRGRSYFVDDDYISRRAEATKHLAWSHESVFESTSLSPAISPVP